MQDNLITGGEGSASDFVAHWDWAASKGLLKKNTANALKTAATRVLRAEGEDWDRIDVRSIDPDNLLDRFENLAKRDFTPSSLSTYRSRFKKALSLYLSYLEDPRGYRPQGRERAVSSERGRPKVGNQSGRIEVDSVSVPVESTQSSVRMVRYPFPVRIGVIGELLLPADLRKEEVKRLIAFLDSVAVEPTDTET
jgi:hypothetical protein